MDYILISIAIMAVFILLMLVITVILYHRIAETGRRRAKMDSADYREEMFGKDEIGDLVKSFNSMESALREQMENVAQMTAEREKTLAELNIATRIQADMIPQNFTAISGKGMCDIYGCMTPAKEVGGDFYDFFALDEDRLCLVIADVSGKGVPAALFMTKSKIYIKQRVLAAGSPSQILADVNNELCADNREMLFVTVWLGIVNTKSGELTYCNAGHEYPVIVHNGESRLLKEDKNDPPLALAEGFQYNDKNTQLQKGDLLFVYTDGVPEAKNTVGERYGTDRMMERLVHCETDASCQDIIQFMKTDVDSFADNQEPFDDVTMLLIRINT